MRVVFYCQHVLGIGHFHRALALADALAPHEVILVTGGPELSVTLPPHVRHFPLPPLAMGESFGALVSPEGADVEAVAARRQHLLFDLFRDAAPDVFLVELFPFGRKKFGRELLPILKAIRSGELPPCKVACSLRDILVEREDADKFERRAVAAANEWFDLVLLHADPALQRLEETFGAAGELRVPVAYTGFIARAPAQGARERLRAELGLSPDVPLIVGSAGGGKVGGELLAALARAFRLLPRPARLLLHSGPYMDAAEYAALAELAAGDPDATLARFAEDFPDRLAAADLSVSLGGYNTTMNILAARVPALVYPFRQNREQGLRAAKLEELGILGVLDPADLEPEILARRMAALLTRRERTGHHISLDGAARSARCIEALAANEPVPEGET